MMERTSIRWHKVCKVCAEPYVMQKKGNPQRCPKCQQEYRRLHPRGRKKYQGFAGQGNSGHRPMGHNTRGFHKRVPL
jgi:hypothetical protein